MKKILVLLFVLGYSVAEAQVNNVNKRLIDDLPKEIVSIQVNSNLLLAGESLLYKVEALNAETKTESLISSSGYVSLIGNNDTIVFNQKIKLNDGKGSGYFFIPSNLASGSYELLGYTNFSKNNLTNPVDSKSLVIINPFVASKNVRFADSLSKNIIRFEEKNRAALASAASDNSLVDINLSKSVFSKRESVELNFKDVYGKILNGDLLLSVRKVMPVNLPENLSQQKIFSEVNDNKTLYLPELRGEIISGKITATNNELPIINKVIALSIPGKNFITKLAKTDSEGNFLFSVSENYNSNEAIFQIVDVEKDNYTIKINSKSDVATYATTIPFPDIDMDLKEWLVERSISLQIENAFYGKKGDSIKSTSFDQPFFGNQGTNYVLDEYTRFPTMTETFVEIVFIAGVRRDGEKRKFIVKDYDENASTNAFSSLEPMVLMDGVYIQNNDEVLDYNPDKVESIRVIPVPYRYGPKLFGGIISILTKDGSFRPKSKDQPLETLEINNFVEEKINYSPSYLDDQSLDRIPDNRVQLLWNPKFEMSKNSGKVNFFTSDETGIFEIKLSGITKGGENISEKAYFKVE